MFSNWFSRLRGSEAGAEVEGAERDAEETDEQKPDDVPQRTLASTAGSPRWRAGEPRHERHFSENEFADSGFGSSFMSERPFEGLQGTEIDEREYEEEFILAKLQDVQRRLQSLRVRKRTVQASLARSTSNNVAGKPARRCAERLFVSSHRLPLAIEFGADGRVRTSVPTASLGLISAFRDLLEQCPIDWVGEPGRNNVDISTLSQAERASLKRHFSNQSTKLSLLNYVPIFPDPDDAMAHIAFCNSVIWPLFHYMPLSYEGERAYHVDMFDSYRKINQFHADAIIEEWANSGVGESDAMVWIHDIHLLLVPNMIRQRLPGARIGFFLHTPFPAGEVFRTLPTRREILEGMLGADLVGFHTYDYARHFLSCCERLLGLETRPDGVDDKGVFVKVGIYPFGIDSDTFLAAMKKTSVNQRVGDIRAGLSGKKIILGVDRLDYIKGIPHKLLAIEHFLETHPEWVGKVVLLQVTAPSQSQSEEYSVFRSGILELVGRINGRFSTLDDIPILYREAIMTFDEMCALYASADVAVLTSLRDGMNLASYEYVMCQREFCGALVLSEFTGAARNLPGAILCNPWNIEDVSDAIHRALTMPDFERELKFQKLYHMVTKRTSAAWGVNFVQDVTKNAIIRKKSSEALMRVPIDETAASYAAAEGTRLLLLDYDGTLRHYESQPELAEPSIRLLDLLERLARCERNVVFIVTGRQKATMMKWMDGRGVGFAVEHGFSVRWPDHLRGQFGGTTHPPDPELTAMLAATGAHNAWAADAGDTGWDDLLSPRNRYLARVALEQAGAKLRSIADHTPSTFVTQKESAYSWHFRDADPEFAGSHARDARNVLEEMVTNTPMEVVMGQQILYVRPRGINKGASASEVVRRLREGGAKAEWIFCVGDDRTDEDMFKVLEQISEEEGVAVTTCTVGKKRTAAKYFLGSVTEVLELLETFANA